MHRPEPIQVLFVNVFESILIRKMAVRSLIDVACHGRKLVLRVLKPDGLDVGESVGRVLCTGGLNEVQNNCRILSSVEGECELSRFENIKQSVQLFQSVPNLFRSIRIMVPTSRYLLKQRPVFFFSHTD